MPRILTVKQAAEELQADEQTVRDWLRRGRIPGRRIGRSWRISEEALHEWMKGDPPKERVSARGILSDVEGLSTERFMQEKQEEIDREEAKFNPNPRQ